jgi:hypothetical protein
MTLYPVLALAYDNVADEIVEGATGGQVYASQADADAGTNVLTVYGNAGETLSEVSSNASGVMFFQFADRTDGWVKFPGRPAIHVWSTSVPALAQDAASARLAAQAAQAAAEAAAQDARSLTVTQTTGNASFTRAGELLVATGTTAQDFTIRLDADWDTPPIVGTTVSAYRVGTGTVRVVSTTDQALMKLHPLALGNLFTVAEGGMVTAVKIAADEWIISGNYA